MANNDEWATLIQSIANLISNQIPTVDFTHPYGGPTAVSASAILPSRPRLTLALADIYGLNVSLQLRKILADGAE